MNSIRLEINQTRTLLFAMRDQLTNKVAAYETMKMIGIPINHNSMVIARRDLTSCLTVTRDLGTLFMNQHANGGVHWTRSAPKRRKRSGVFTSQTRKSPRECWRTSPRRNERQGRPTTPR